MAVPDSVTVSIAALTSGMFNSMRRDSLVFRMASFGDLAVLRYQQQVIER